jgi:hypothetical protein
VQELEEEQKVLCNLCATCIVDLHRTCTTCHWDICLTCCAELAAAGGTRAALQQALRMAQQPQVVRPGSSGGSSGAGSQQQQQQQQQVAAALLNLAALLRGHLAAGEVVEPGKVQGGQALVCVNPTCSKPQRLQLGRLLPHRVLQTLEQAAAWPVPLASPAAAASPAATVEAVANTGAASAPSPRAALCTSVGSRAAAAAALGFDPYDDKWWTHVPREWLRKASSRGSQDYLFCPHQDDLKGCLLFEVATGSSGGTTGTLSDPPLGAAPGGVRGDSPEGAAHAGSSSSSGGGDLRAQVLFRARWELGEPVVVRGVRGRMSWSPDTMRRATMDQKAGERDLNVIDCADWSQGVMSVSAFFKEYLAADPQARLLKVRDWPPAADFRTKLGRHYQVGVVGVGVAGSATCWPACVWLVRV